MISSAGIGSGLDVNSIVRQLVAVERQPIRLLQGEATRLETQISAFGRLQGSLSTLRDAAGTLATVGTWQQSRATSSAGAVSASTAGAAQPGTYRVDVQQLASGQTLASATRYASPQATLGSGILRIELGDFDSDPPVPKAGATPVDILIDTSATSLADVRDRINGAGAGVVASIVNDIGGSRLVIRSAETGQENGFRITAIDDDGNDADTAGLSALAFDPAAGGISNLQRPQQASDAVALVDGLEVRSATNTLAGTIEGLTLQLRQLGQAEVTVEPDTEALKKAVDEFVNAFNQSIQLLRSQTAFDPETSTAGPLQGDPSGRSLLARLRNEFTGDAGPGGAFRRLADIGLTLNTDGTVRTDAAKLNAALANPAEIGKLFANADEAVPANRGLGTRMQAWLRDTLDGDSPLASRSESLRQRVRDNQEQQERLEDRVLRTEQRLLRQYQALDARMGQLQGLAGYVSQQIALLNNSGGNSR